MNYDNFENFMLSSYYWSIDKFIDKKKDIKYIYDYQNYDINEFEVYIQNID